jgi:penicillin-binding protein 1C
LLKAFARLPPEDNRAPAPPAEVIRAASALDLPPLMRTLGPAPATPGAPTGGGPRIAYPPADARIDVGLREPVPLIAAGGSGKLRWLVDGRPIDDPRWVPEGPGTARVAVVDEAGRSSAVTVRIVLRP